MAFPERVTVPSDPATPLRAVGLDDILRALDAVYGVLRTIDARLSEQATPTPVTVSVPAPEVVVPEVVVPPLELTPLVERIGEIREFTERVTDLVRRLSERPTERWTIPGQAVDPVLLEHIRDQKPTVDIRFDYGTRTDRNPVYVGRAAPGTATSDDGWWIQRYTYSTDSSGNARPDLVQVRTGAWDDRANLGW